MTRKELQDALRPYKTEFAYIKLNAKTDQLQAWWNEINGQQTLDLDSNEDEFGTVIDSNQTEYWKQWQSAYDKAIAAIQVPEKEAIQSVKPPSFCGATIVLLSLIMDGVKCFADMFTQILKTITKKRKKPVGFGV